MWQRQRWRIRDRTHGGGDKADLDGRCRVIEILQRRKPPRWRVKVEGGCGGKGRGRRRNKMSARSTITKDEEMARC